MELPMEANHRITTDPTRCGGRPCIRDLRVIAGPNGAGKTTAAPRLLHTGVGIDAFVNADVIAEGLSGFSPASAAFEAGRIMLRRLDESWSTVRRQVEEHS